MAVRERIREVSLMIPLMVGKTRLYHCKFESYPSHQIMKSMTLHERLASIKTKYEDITDPRDLLDIFVDDAKHHQNDTTLLNLSGHILRTMSHIEPNKEMTYGDFEEVLSLMKRYLDNWILS